MHSLFLSVSTSPSLLCFLSLSPLVVCLGCISDVCSALSVSVSNRLLLDAEWNLPPFSWMYMSCSKSFMQTLKRTEGALLNLTRSPQHGILYSLVTVVQPVTNLTNCNRLNNWTQRVQSGNISLRSQLGTKQAPPPPPSVCKRRIPSQVGATHCLWMIIQWWCCASGHVSSVLVSIVWSVRCFLLREFSSHVFNCLKNQKGYEQ